MKKILIIAAIMCIFGVGANAADLNFTPEGGGKWIFCNNPEALKNRDLMNSGDNPPSYIMNNENLEPDLYDFILCHINHTSTRDDYGAGYNIELDIELTAVEDSEITINRVSFETPEDEAFIYSNGTWAKEMNKVGCIHGLASFLGVNLAELNGAWLYEAEEYEPVTVGIKKGETIWLSEFIDNYSTVAYGKPVQIMGEIALNSGKMNMNVAAFKASEELRDRSGFEPNAKFGEYTYTRTQKGIADSLPKVSVSAEYTIGKMTKNGERMPNKVFNQYEPEGYVTETWCTHLSPQDDIWSKTISVQSDLLSMTYPDESKKTYYGSKVSEKDKDGVWIWDPYHSDTAKYPGTSTWYKADRYEPNYHLSVKRGNEGYACSLGNYAVTETYNLKVKNTSDTDRYFEYVVETAANVAVFVEDADGKHSGYVKGEHDTATSDVMASVKIPANSEKEFSFNLVLPINYVGGIRNSFVVSDTKSTGKTYEDYLKEPRAAKGPLIAGVPVSDVKDKIPDEVKEITDGNYDRYELIKSYNGYMLRWTAWDSCPYYYTANWDKVKTIYYLDENYNLVDKYKFDSLICFALFRDGQYYVQDAGGNRFKSYDGQNWEAYSGKMPLPEVEFNNDKPSLWAQSELERAYMLGAAPYELKDKLIYEGDMTRETFCYVLSTMLGLKGELPDEGELKFSDTESRSVSRLANAGIINGYTDGTFRPKNPITREEAAMLLYQAAKYLDCYLSDEEYAYADNSDISDWARSAVYSMNNAGIMTGMDENKFEPKRNYTNEQSIATIMRLYDAA